MKLRTVLTSSGRPVCRSPAVEQERPFFGEKDMERSDFYLCYNFVLANWFAYPGPTQRELEKVRHDLHAELGRWQPGRPEPDWNAYGERMNTICRRDAFPVPFLRAASKAVSGAQPSVRTSASAVWGSGRDAALNSH
jgi:hypothetical protein